MSLFRTTKVYNVTEWTKNDEKLMNLVKKNDILKVQQCIKRGFMTSKIDPQSGLTSLQQAVWQGNSQMVQILLQAPDVNVNARDSKGKTALLIALEKGHKSIAEDLIQSGADVQATDFTGSTPMHCAVTGGHLDCVSLLLSNKSLIDEPNKNSQTPLHISAKKGQATIASLLLKNGAAVNKKDRNGRTPLMMASMNGHASLCGFLLGKGANEEEVDNDGEDTLQTTYLCPKCMSCIGVMHQCHACGRANSGLLEGHNALWYAIEHNKTNVKRVLQNNTSHLSLTPVRTPTPTNQNYDEGAQESLGINGSPDSTWNSSIIPSSSTPETQTNLFDDSKIQQDNDQLFLKQIHDINQLISNSIKTVNSDEITMKPVTSNLEQVKNKLALIETLYEKKTPVLENSVLVNDLMKENKRLEDMLAQYTIDDDNKFLDRKHAESYRKLKNRVEFTDSDNLIKCIEEALNHLKLVKDENEQLKLQIHEHNKEYQNMIEGYETRMFVINENLEKFGQACVERDVLYQENVSLKNLMKKLNDPLNLPSSLDDYLIMEKSIELGALKSHILAYQNLEVDYKLLLMKYTNLKKDIDNKENVSPVKDLSKASAINESTVSVSHENVNNLSASDSDEKDIQKYLNFYKNKMLDDFEKVIDNYKQSVIENNELKKKLDEVKSEVRMNSDYDYLIKEIEGLRDQTNHLTKLLDEADKKNESLLNTIAETDYVSPDQKPPPPLEQTNIYIDMNENLNKKINELQNSLQEKDSNIKKLENDMETMNNLTSENSYLQNALQETQTELKEIEARVKDYGQLAVHSDVIEKELELLQKTEKNLEKEKHDLQNEIRFLKNSQQNETSTNANELIKMTSEIHALKQSLSDLEKENDLLKKQEHMKEQEMLDMVEKLQNCVAQQKMVLDEKEKNVQELNDEVINYETLSVEYDKLQKDAVRQNQKAAEEVENLKRKIDLMSIKLEEERNLSGIRLEEINGLKNSLIKKDCLLTEINELKKEKEDVNTALEKYKKFKDELQKANELLDERLEENNMLKISLDKNSNFLREVQMEKEELKKKLEQSNKVINELENEKDNMNNRGRKHKDLVDNLMKENELFKKELIKIEESNKNLEIQLKELETEKAQTSVYCKELNKILENNLISLSELAREEDLSEKRRVEINELKIKLKELEMEKTQNYDENKELNKLLENNKILLSDLTKEKDLSEKRRIEINELKNKLHKKGDADEEKGYYMEENKKLNNVNYELSKRLNILKADLLFIQNQINKDSKNERNIENVKVEIDNNLVKQLPCKNASEVMCNSIDYEKVKYVPLPYDSIITQQNAKNESNKVKEIIPLQTNTRSPAEPSTVDYKRLIENLSWTNKELIRKQDLNQAHILDLEKQLNDVRHKKQFNTNDNMLSTELGSLRESNFKLSMEVADLKYKLHEKSKLLNLGVSVETQEERKLLHEKMRQHDEMVQNYENKIADYIKQIAKLRSLNEELKSENAKYYSEICDLREIVHIYNRNNSQDCDSLVMKFKNENEKFRNFLDILNERLKSPLVTPASSIKDLSKVGVGIAVEVGPYPYNQPQHDSLQEQSRIVENFNHKEFHNEISRLNKIINDNELKYNERIKQYRGHLLAAFQGTLDPEVKQALLKILSIEHGSNL